jgi:tripartite-type tricarboxylate transporter receptor subunit TctC
VGQARRRGNRPGGNGFIAIRALKGGDKDGYDLIQLDNVHITAYPYLFKQLPYDPKGDFEILAPLFKASFFFAVATEQPVQERGRPHRGRKAEARPAQLRSWSIGNPVHLGSEVFESTTGTKIGPHRLQGDVAALHGVANGDIAWALGSYGTSGSLQRGGQASLSWPVAGPKRLAGASRHSDGGEAGGPKDFEVSGWTDDRRAEVDQSRRARRSAATSRRSCRIPEILQRYDEPSATSRFRSVNSTRTLRANRRSTRT